MGERTDRDEEELQEILKKNPRSKRSEDDDVDDPIKCIFCDNLAYMYVEAEDVAVDPRDVDGLVPVCESCYPDEVDDDECFECLVGNYCSEHMYMTEAEYLLGQLIRNIGEDDDEDV